MNKEELQQEFNDNKGRLKLGAVVNTFSLLALGLGVVTNYLNSTLNESLPTLIVLGLPTIGLIFGQFISDIKEKKELKRQLNK